jgi:E3 ubiquitin-protein ligase Topors
MTDMQEILITNDITSEDFRQYMRRHCRNSTNHFIHEFLNYARSPYDMVGYDRNVRYTPYFNSEPQLILSSSDDDQTIDATSINDDVIRVTNPSVGRSGSGGGSGRTQFTIETRSAHSTVIVTGSFGGGGSSSSSNNCSAAETATATTTTTTTSSSQSNDTPQPISNRRSLVHQFYDSVPLRNGSESPHQQQAQIVSRNISLSSDTDSDECRFVLERKPPHLRTPEMVSLGSDSDSDVVYIETNDKAVPPAAVDSGATNRSKKFRILQCK